MLKADQPSNTGDRAVAPEIHAAGRGCPKTAPGLTLETDRNRNAKAEVEDGPFSRSASGDVGAAGYGSFKASPGLTSSVEDNREPEAASSSSALSDQANRGTSRKAGEAAGRGSVKARPA